jgi:phosphatidate cytidylyltransferase
MRSKLVMGLVLGSIGLGCLFWSDETLLVLLMVLALIAGGEMFRLARARGTRPAALVGLLAIAGAYALAYDKGPNAPERYPALVAAVFIAAAAVVLLRRDRGHAVTSIAVTVFVFVYVGMMGSYMMAMRGDHDGFRVVLIFGLMVILNDVGAWLLGNLAGRRPFAPTLSPDKTWEGIAGGALFTMLVGVIVGVGLDPPMTLSRGLVLAALVVPAAPLGDLFESMLKRDFGVKDAGAVIPAHGGALDRLDSLLFTAPIFFYAYRALVT